MSQIYLQFLGVSINKKMSMKPVFMDDARFDQIVSRVTDSYPNSCVLYIDEIQNPVLENRYQLRKAEIQRNRGSVKEMSLFHGTHEKFIDVIATNGFDPTLNTRAAFGYGVYFARDAKYSSAYMVTNKPENHAFMFMADVLVGQTGTLGLKGDARYDNNVDRHSDPSIVTTVYPDGAFPRYIIAFYKDAK
jgi:hypothetical protein